MSEARSPPIIKAIHAKGASLIENRSEPLSPPLATESNSAVDKSMPLEDLVDRPEDSEGAGGSEADLERLVGKPPRKRAREGSQSATSSATPSISDFVAQYDQTMAIGKLSTEAQDYARYPDGFDDQWAGAGTSLDAQDPSYDEDLSFPSDILTNTWSVPEMNSNSSISLAATDITDDTPKNNDDTLPHSHEYSDVYLDI